MLNYNDDNDFDESIVRPIPSCREFYRLQDGIGRIICNLVFEFRSSVKDYILSSIVIFISSKSKKSLLVVFDDKKDVKRDAMVDYHFFNFES